MDKTKYVFIKYIPTFSAGGEGRTPTGLLPQGPKPCASANFATPAILIYKENVYIFIL